MKQWQVGNTAAEIMNYLGNTDDLCDSHDVLGERAISSQVVEKEGVEFMRYQFVDGDIVLGTHTTYGGNAHRVAAAPTTAQKADPIRPDLTPVEEN